MLPVSPDGDRLLHLQKPSTRSAHGAVSSTAGSVAPRFATLNQIGRLSSSRHHSSTPTQNLHENRLDSILNNHEILQVQSIERRRSALLQQLASSKQEIRKLKEEISEAKRARSTNGAVNGPVNGQLNAVVAQLLLSNNEAVNSLLVSHANTTPIASSLPHAPDSELDLGKLRQLTGLHLDTVSVDIDYTSLDPGEEPSALRITKHLITVSHPESKITFALSFTVNQTDLELVDFSVDSSTIHPPWAVRPIAQFAEQLADDSRNRNAAGRCNISNFLYGVSEFARLSIIRAKTFMQINNTFPSLTNGPGRIRSSHRVGFAFWIGQPLLIVSEKHCKLVISWDLLFDISTGDVSSRITTHMSAPSYYKTLDIDKLFPKIPLLFNTLLKTRGVYSASCILIRNLFDS
ncbi:uncharacterized protein V1516DRAFT_627547 [Lipomyces oligophaga]|uniref:uncharacterized protein n=1 Tax=Lipomyces oligophaga TaxID=45792 RepID=UPI0034CDCE4B